MKIGVIGLGLRASHVMKEIQNIDPSCKIAALVDPKHQQTSGIDSEAYTLYNTPEEMLQEEQLDGVLIGTRCSLHTEMALKVLPSGIPLYMEKPVATTMEDLLLLKAGY